MADINREKMEASRLHRKSGKGSLAFTTSRQPSQKAGLGRLWPLVTAGSQCENPGNGQVVDPAKVGYVLVFQLWLAA